MQTTNTVATSPQNGMERPLHIPKLAVDAGNRGVKIGTHPETVRTLPSCLRILKPYDTIAPAPDSIAVRYDGGSQADLIGQRWAVGKQAIALKGQHIFKAEKTELAHYSLFAGITAVLSRNDCRVANISTLATAIPDHLDRETAATIRATMVGVHHLTVDDRKSLTVKVGSVQIRPEGLDAWRWLMKQGAYALPDRLSGTLDIGGGTSIASLYRPDTGLIVESRITLPGVFHLAQKICTALSGKGLEGKGCSPRADLVMDGIASGRYDYGTTGYCFQGEFNAELPDWLESLREEVKTAWGGWFNEIGTVAIIGGGASLAASLTERTAGRMFVATQPEYCTVRGMLL